MACWLVGRRHTRTRRLTSTHATQMTLTSNASTTNYKNGDFWSLINFTISTFPADAAPRFTRASGRRHESRTRRRGSLNAGRTFLISSLKGLHRSNWKEQLSLKAASIRQIALVYRELSDNYHVHFHLICSLLFSQTQVFCQKKPAVEPTHRCMNLCGRSLHVGKERPVWPFNMQCDKFSPKLQLVHLVLMFGAYLFLNK